MTARMENMCLSKKKAGCHYDIRPKEGVSH